MLLAGPIGPNYSVFAQRDSDRDYESVFYLLLWNFFPWVSNFSFTFSCSGRELPMLHISELLRCGRRLGHGPPYLTSCPLRVIPSLPEAQRRRLSPESPLHGLCDSVQGTQGTVTNCTRHHLSFCLEGKEDFGSGARS